MRRVIIALSLQLYALACTLVQVRNGVRTDEAKYLLNIPYPHPPLARWFFSLFDGYVWQEACIRFFMATLMVQAVWIVWDMGRSLRFSGRIAISVLWLCSAAFIVQAGTVMMAPLTALQTLVFLWILSLPKERLPGMPVMGFLWLITLFTALQGVLLAPLVFAALRLHGASWKQVALYFCAPLALVGLYALGNPLIAASMLIQSGKDAGDPMAVRAAGLLWILVLAGSGVGTFVGLLGLALKKHAWIACSFLLLVAYVFVGRFEYYAILFVPFFITGTKHLLRRMPRAGLSVGVGVLVATLAILASSSLLFGVRSPARDTLRRAGTGIILIRNAMGHEWQYEALAGQDVRPFTRSLLSDARAVVCFSDCKDLEADWISLSSTRGLWLRR